MKNNYTPQTVQSTFRIFWLIAALLTGSAFAANAQVTFAPRGSSHNIHGDFQMIGNTNLTLVNYGPDTQNGNSTMVAVDADGTTGFGSATTNSSSANLVFSTENGALPAGATIVYAGLYWSGRTDNHPTTDQKRTIKFKGPADAAYTTLQAATTDIQFPGNDNMYVAYKDVTTLVTNSRDGEYWVADMSLTTGRGDAVGYFGGWGLVVVYENPVMNLRDITVFDGYAYIQSAVTAKTLAVSGFQTVATGDVNMKLGLMAGEGDRGITGDYFKIRNHADNAWVALSHSLNTADNFFTSSILTGANPRNPTLVNNTGLDICMFNVPNPGNSVIDNGQTATTFQYGSTLDTYIIYSIVMSVNAFNPGISLAKACTNLVPIYTAVNDPLGYDYTVSNTGDVSISGVNLVDNKTAAPSLISGDANTNGILDVGETWTYHVSYSVVQADIDAGFITNQATVTGTSANNVPVTATAYATVYVKPIVKVTQPTCVVATGSIEVTAPLGTGITYKLNDGPYQSSPTFGPLSPGDYIVTAKTPTITTSGQAVTIVTLQLPAAAAGTDRAICLNASTTLGAAPVTGSTYSWSSDPAGFTSALANPTVTPLETTTYTVQETTADGCTNSNNVKVTVNSLPAAPTFNITQPTCSVATGTITVTAPTGTGYTYSLNSGAYQAGTAFAGLAAGDYTLTAKNSNGCVSVTSLTATINGQLATPDKPTLTVTQTTCVLDYGKITVTAPTATGMTYSIDGSTYTNTTGIFDPVAIGTYSITARNAAGCTSAATSATINPQPSLPGAPTVDKVTQPTCSVATGSVDLGGLPAGDWTLMPGSITGTGTTKTISGLAAGTYNYTVTNAGGCVSPASRDIVITSPPGAPAKPVATATAQPTCLVATGTITVTDPLQTLTYSINGTDYSATGIFTGLAAGDYTVTAKNADGCLSPASDKVTINAQPATPAAPTLSLTQPTCDLATGTITVTAPLGETLKYSIGGTWQTSPVFSGLIPGKYTVTVKNASECVSSGTDATINTAPQTLPVPTLSLTQPTCSVATGTITVTAPTGMTYSIDGSTYTNTSGIFTGVAPGTYSVTARSAGGCTSSPASATIDPQPATPPAPAATATAQPTCNVATGTITVTAPTGEGYTYSIGGAYQAGTTFNGVAVGTWSVTAKNSAGCISAGTSVTINPAPAALTLLSKQVTSPILCNGGTATVTLIATGGTSPYSYTFNGTTNATGVFAGVLAGTAKGYSITDAGQCPPVTGNLDVTQPDALVMGQPVVTDINCLQSTTGTIVISATGGTGTISYSILPAVGTQSPAGTFKGLTAQAYTITAKDANNCSTSAQATVSAAPDITPPSITCKPNISQFADPGKCSAIITIIRPDVVDGCATKLTTIGLRSDGLALTEAYPTGVTSIVWTASDQDGNVSTSCTQTITVIDNENPVIVTCASDQSVLANSNCQALVPDFTGGIIATDNCTPAGNLVITQSPLAGTLANAGSTIITITVTDGNNNTAICTATFTATSPIIANDDDGDPVNGLTGGTGVANILLNDRLNCAVPDLDQVNLSTVSSTHPNIRISGTSVVADPGTPTGIYSLVYRICEKSNPGNCDDATVTFVVVSPSGGSMIDAVEDAGGIGGVLGGVAVPNVLANDKLNGVIVIPSQVILSFVSTTNPNVTLNGSQVMVAPETPNGTYLLTYRICEALNPTNCDQAVVTVLVTRPISGPLIDAIADEGSVNGGTGGTAVANVLVNDLLNGNPVLPSQVVTTFISSTSPNVTLDGAEVIVAPNTAPGVYSLDYRICEVLSPTNCDQATVTVNVRSAVNTDLAVLKTAVEKSYSAVGDLIHYNIVVTNNGTASSYYNLSISDANAVITSGNPIGVLAPGKNATMTAVHTVTQADLDAGKVTNVATLTGTDPQGFLVTSSSNSVVVNGLQRSQLTITKYATETTFHNVGEVIHYTFEIFNCGNVTNSNIVVSDPKAVILTGGLIASLAPRHTVTATGEHVVTQADITAGKIVNVAMAEGIDPSGKQVRDDSNEVVLFANQPAQMVVAKFADETSFKAIGDTIHFTIAVKNFRNTEMSDIYVSDANAVIKSGGYIWRLGAGKTSLAYAYHVVNQADLNAGKVVNVATARGKDFYDVIDRATSNEVTVFAKQEPVLVLTKSAVETSYANVGDLIHYTNEIRNDGNVRITGITLDDPNTTASGNNQVASLAPGESVTLKTTRTVSQSDLNLGLIEQTASISGYDANTQPIRQVSNPVVVKGVQNTQLATSLTSAETTYSLEGDIIHYTIEVRNTGNVTLTNLDVTDAIAGVTEGNSIPVLAPGAVSVVNAVKNITQADLAAGKVVNLATATAYNPKGEKISRLSNELVVTAGKAERLIVSKIAQESGYAKVGDVIHYVITVKNGGKIPVSDIAITVPDALITGSPVIANLPALTGATVLATHEVTQADLDAGSINNAATISGKYPDGTAYTEKSNPVTIYGQQDPQLKSGISASETTFATIGQVISFSIQLTNAGNVTLTEIDLSSQSALTFGSAGPVSLAPGRSATVSAQYTVTIADLDAGKVVKSVNATGKDPGKQPVRVTSNEITVAGLQNPALATTGSSLETSYRAVGEVIHYTISVKNSGNVSIISTAVTDPNSVIIDARPNTILLPGESFTANAVRTVTQADINAGKVVTAAKAEGFDLNGNTITKMGNPVTVTAIQLTEMDVEANPYKTVFENVGDRIDYSIRVTNNGNISLFNVKVSDQNATVSLDKPIAELLPGESVSVPATHGVTQADMDAGKVISVARAFGSDLNGKPVLKDGNTLTFDGIQNHELVAKTNASAGTYKKEGEVIAYTVQVTNTGNVTMKGITITDPQTLLTFGNAIPSLAPGETAMVEAGYTITNADLYANAVVTAPVAVCTDANNRKFSYTGNDVTILRVIEDLNLSNYPNPFSYETTITFDLPEDGKVILRVYDVTGKEAGVIERNFSRGRNSVVWRMNTTQKGMYYLKMIYKGGQANKIMTITN